MGDSLQGPRAPRPGAPPWGCHTALPCQGSTGGHSLGLVQSPGSKPPVGHSEEPPCSPELSPETTRATWPAHAPLPRPEARGCRSASQGAGPSPQTQLRAGVALPLSPGCPLRPHSGHQQAARRQPSTGPRAQLVACTSSHHLQDLGLCHPLPHPPGALGEGQGRRVCIPLQGELRPTSCPHFPVPPASPAAITEDGTFLSASQVPGETSHTSLPEIPIVTLA